MPVNVIVGLQRGDEGKGRFVDMLAEEHDIVARFNGGNNAGHTVVLPDGRDLALHQVPSGIAHEHITNVIGNGALLNPEKLIEEIESIKSKDIEVGDHNLKLSSAAHLILPQHIYEDRIREAGENRQGSTCSGIAPVASYKAMRSGARLEMVNNDPNGLYEMIYHGLKAQRFERKVLELEDVNEIETAKEYIDTAKKLGPYITDTVLYINKQLTKDKPSRVLAEGAQAFLLDIDQGMYPFTTSSNTTSGGVTTGLGVAPHHIEYVTGVAKAVQSHVGGGPFVTEIKESTILNALHGDMNKIDAEKGTTTGRTRRLGYLDLPQIRRAQMVNGDRQHQTMAISKLDWVNRFGPLVKVCVEYERKGKILDIAPDAAYKLEQCKPVYEELPTWEEDIQDIRHFEDLPKNAQKYIHFIEEETGVFIEMIGVGPKRNQVIER